VLLTRLKNKDMTISDIITIISLVIAIVAIISEKNRKHLLLKFSYFDLGLYISAFILINYFVFYNHFYSKGLYLDILYFKTFGLKNPLYYSYIISIVVLISILFKIWFSFYPYRKKTKVIKYYKSLIENNDIPTLLDLIETYHLNDTCNYIRRSKDYNPDSEDWFNERFRRISVKEKVINALKRSWQNFNPYSKLNRYSYSRYILYNIINDPAFVALASNDRPYFFATLIKHFKKKKRNSFPDDLTKLFLVELIKTKNFWLIKELKLSDNFDTGQPESFFDENKIIAALIQDVSVAETNEIWIPFGEEAIKEIENEMNLGIDSRLNQEYRNGDILWEYKTYISIRFFKILIIESIAQKYSGTHFFLHYYWYITDKILKNLSANPPVDYEKKDSLYHYLINKMNDNLFHWLDLANKKESDIFHDVINCIGSQINCLTSNPYFGEKRKIDLIEKVFRSYCHLERNSKTDLIRDKLDIILKKPNMLTNPTDPYYTYVAKTWTSFDKAPHRGYSNSLDADYFARLKRNVIIPLNLNPNEY